MNEALRDLTYIYSLHYTKAINYMAHILYVLELYVCIYRICKWYLLDLRFSAYYSLYVAVIN